jgi:hypothetical protein
MLNDWFIASVEPSSSVVVVVGYTNVLSASYDASIAVAAQDKSPVERSFRIHCHPWEMGQCLSSKTPAFGREKSLHAI